MNKLFTSPDVRKKVEALLRYTELSDSSIEKILNLTCEDVDRILSKVCKPKLPKKPVGRRGRKPGPFAINNIILADYGLDRRRKLTLNQIEEIKTEYERGVPVKTLALDYGVSTTCIRYHVVPGYKQLVNGRSKELHSLYVTKEQERIHSKKLAQRRKEIFKKIKSGEIQKLPEDKR